MNQSELDSVKQDAARYRYLRQAFSNSHFLDHMDYATNPAPGADEVDAAIDEAMNK